MIVLIAGDRVRIGGKLVIVADVYYDRGRVEITDTAGKTWYATAASPAKAVATR